MSSDEYESDWLGDWDIDSARQCPKDHRAAYRNHSERSQQQEEGAAAPPM